MTPFELFIVGQLMVATLLVLWFIPRTPIHFFQLLRWLGWKPGNAFWMSSPAEMSFWTRKDLQNWMAMKLPTFWAELLNCPYCLGTHFGLYTALFLCLALHAPWYFIVIGPFGWGALANLLLHKNEH